MSRECWFTPGQRLIQTGGTHRVSLGKLSQGSTYVEMRIQNPGVLSQVSSDSIANRLRKGGSVLGAYRALLILFITC